MTADVHPPVADADGADATRLAQLGYKQELRRALNIAIGAVYSVVSRPARRIPVVGTAAAEVAT
jgi:hypothetical protein